MKVKLFLALLVLSLVGGLMLMGCSQPLNTSVSNYVGVSITPEAISLSVGERQQFMVRGLVISATAGAQNFNWSITGAIGTIDTAGLFLATAEGVGMVEARADSIVGRAIVTVIAGKTIIGRVTDLTSRDPIPGALVYAGGKTTTADSSGYYSLRGVSVNADSVTVQVGGYAPFTVFTTKEAADVELSLIPVEQATPLGYFQPNSTIVGEVRSVNGNPEGYINIYLSHRYYRVNGSSNSNGKFSISCYLDPSKMPFSAFLSVATSTKAGIKKVTIQNTGVVDVGTIEVDSHPGLITGEVRIPYPTYNWSSGYVSWQIMDANGRFWEGSGSETINSSGVYSLNLPATPAGIKYYLKVEGRSPDYSHNTSKYLENVEIASGEVRKIDFTLPNFITPEAPADGAVTTGLAPVLSWISPDPKFNLYFIFLYDSGRSGYFKWVGVTDKMSITYPSFLSGSGFEGLNLEANKGYVWIVYGYYIPGFSLQANMAQVSGIVSDVSRGMQTFSSGDSIRAMTGIEIKQALEQTMSGKAFYFGTGSIPYVTTTTTTTSTSTTSSSTTTTI